jgi:anti-sigma-K factor RskA
MSQRRKQKLERRTKRKQKRAQQVERWRNRVRPAPDTEKPDANEQMPPATP